MEYWESCVHPRIVIMHAPEEKLAEQFCMRLLCSGLHAMRF